MPGTLRTIASLVLVSLAAASACTVKDHPDGSNGDAGTNASGADGAGTAGKSGGGSSTTQAGASGKAGKAGGGSAGKGGAGGTKPISTDAGAGQDGGAAGQGGDGPACPGCASGFCLADGTCVDCLPANDHCPLGDYCTADNHCTSGCKADGSSCASGICGDDHNCKNCITDDECVDGLVCGNGHCGPACSEAQEGQTAACDGGLTCCSLHCTDMSIDGDHCGTCGTACNAGQFCGLATCHDATVANICTVTKVIVILDSSTNPTEGDNDPSRAIGHAISAQCPSAPTFSEAEQNSVEALNLTTGRPVSGSNELLVVAGGPFFQNLEGYLEAQKIAPLYWKATATQWQYAKSANDQVVLSLPIAGDHDSHDLFIIQFMHDPASGSLVLNAQGMWLSGTVAGAYLVTSVVLPDLASFNKAWYAYDWTDADGDKAPDANEITLVDSGL